MKWYPFLLPMKSDIFLDIDYLSKRINHLEKLNSWFFEALENLCEIGEIYGLSNDIDDPSKIFQRTSDYLNKTISFKAMGFYLFNEMDADLQESLFRPESYKKLIREEIEFQIEKGECAFALKQNRPVFPIKTISNNIVMLHSIATQKRIRGLFIGILNEKNIPEKHINLYISLLIHLTAHAIEGLELYKIMERNSEFLENLIITKNKELEYNNFYDKLTGLPNRASLITHLNKILDKLYIKKSNPVIILNDIDNFKRVNDTFGNEVGDKILQSISKFFLDVITNFQLKNPIDTNIYLYRFGGDEFIVLLENVSDIDYVANLVRFIHKSFSERKFNVEGEFLIFSLSSGISMFPTDGIDSDILLKRAEIAMYEVKKERGNGFHFFRKGMDLVISRHLEIENKLRIAIERQEFILYYQPKVNIFTNEIVGLEALIRWDNPDKGIIMPSDFIPVAERIGIIHHIGDIVLKIACFDLHNWIKEGLSVVPVAVNVSPGQIGKGDFLAKMLKTMKDAMITSDLIQIEITETTFISDINDKIGVFEEIRDKGIKIFIDDFGTGYSSLSYLHKLPISGLKIDRSFIRDISFNPESKLITRSIIALAQSLNIAAVAEGVETVQHLNILKNLGCKEVQGYLFSKPIHPDMVPELLRNKFITIKHD